jgi:uncharacterized glyoxalase superfamily protein PhnB
MVMKRTKDPWMKAEEFGRNLPKGVGVNLLVRLIDEQVVFCRDVLGAMILYSDADFAAIELAGSVFMLHSDHSYADHPMFGVVDGTEIRGQGVELRIYGVEPDRIEERARQHGHDVLSGSLDKPHGLRECHIIGPEGYIWVPSGGI